MTFLDKGTTPARQTSNLRPQTPYVFPFEKVDVYQMALELADYVLGLLEEIPQNRHLRLISQMEASVVSASGL